LDFRIFLVVCQSLVRLDCPNPSELHLRELRLLLGPQRRSSNQLLLQASAKKKRNAIFFLTPRKMAQRERAFKVVLLGEGMFLEWTFGIAGEGEGIPVLGSKLMPMPTYRMCRKDIIVFKIH
jgi:hypothetical protein